MKLQFRFNQVFLQFILILVLSLNLSFLEPTSILAAIPPVERNLLPITLVFNGPASVEPGESFTVSIEAQDLADQGLYGAQFEVIYDPALITVSNLQPNPDLSFVLRSSVDNSTGRIRLVASREGAVPGLTGNVTLLTFDAVASNVTEATTLTIENAKMSNTQAIGYEVLTQNYPISIGDAPSPQPSETPNPEPTNEPAPEPTDTPAPEPTETPEPFASQVTGQVILSGHANNDWSEATVTMDYNPAPGEALTAVTDSSGLFVITDVPLNLSATVTARAPGYLPAVCSGFIPISPETNLSSVALISGDVVEDNVIDVTDATAIGLNFDKVGRDLSADLNRDDVVDIFDLVLVSRNFGQVGPQEWTCHNPAGQWDTIIEDQVFTETLFLDEGDDNTLILNATFQNIDGSAIMIRDVSNVYIKNCTIHDVREDGIVLRSTGSTHNVTIDGCTISNTGLNGILAKQNEEAGVDHSNVVIKNNTLHNIGTTAFDHGLYIFSTDSLIENNVVSGTTGNGISLRSSAVVRGNKVSDTQGSCIKYYSNHAPGTSDALTIENNVCHLVAEGDADPGISLRRARETPEEWLLQDYFIRFNTVVLRTARRYGVEVESAEFEARHVEVYGNLVINTEDEAKTINPQYIDYLSSNYTSTSLEGFVNSTVSHYDFQLISESSARFYASTEPRFPATDINGTIRTAGFLDAGGYQFSNRTTSDSER